MELNLDLARLLAKAIIIIAFSVTGGILLHNSDIEDIKTGNELTIEKYTANYEAYRKNLTDKEVNTVPVCIAIVFMMIAAFLGFYELLAWVIALVINAIIKPLDKPREVIDLLS